MMGDRIEPRQDRHHIATESPSHSPADKHKTNLICNGDEKLKRWRGGVLRVRDSEAHFVHRHARAGAPSGNGTQTDFFTFRLLYEIWKSVTVHKQHLTNVLRA